MIKVENGKLCVQGAQEDYPESNWKQCTWKEELEMNYGLIKVFITNVLFIKVYYL